MHGFKKIIAALTAFGVLGVSALLLLPLTASAASWSAPFALSSGGIKPSVAVDTSGNQHYVWWTNSGDIQYSKCTGQGGNGCSAPQSLPSSGSSFYPSIAIDPQGRPNVVFETKIGGSVQYAVYWTRKNGNKWSKPKKLSTEPYAELSDIAIGPGGKINVVYQSKRDNTAYVYYTSSAGNGSFAKATKLDEETSVAPLTDFGQLAVEGNAISGTKLSNGLYPRVAADSNDDAQIVWNSPSPYGVKFRRQVNGKFVGTIQVARGHKDQTPDITVAPNDVVGIVWSTYNDFNASFAEYDNGNLDNTVNDIDGGLEQSLWPKVSADCAGNFHFVFQGDSGSDPVHPQWNVYHVTYNPATNDLSNRETIANLSGKQEQTPAVDAQSIAAVAYVNTSNGIVDAATADLGITCGNQPTPTSTNTPSPTSTRDPNITPTITPTPGANIWVPNKSDQITYKKGWKTYNDSKATDGNYARCESGGGACERGSGAKIVVPAGYRHVTFYTARATTYGIASVWINDGENSNSKPSAQIDLCKGSSGLMPKFFVSQTFEIPDRPSGGDRTFEIGGTGKSSSCSPYNSAYIVVDGFMITP